MRFILIFSLMLGFVVTSQAATIDKVKDQMVIIDIAGDNLQKDGRYFGVDASGKKRSILKIITVKKERALARILKGKAEVGHRLIPYKEVSREEAQMAAAPKSAWSHWGVLGSYLMNTMSAKFTIDGVEKTTNMVGNGFGGLAYYDYVLGPNTQLRGMGGLEQFQVSESRSTFDCDKGTSSTCNAIITYLSLYGIFKYYFINGYTKSWFGAGGGYLLALSKSSTVLESSQISSNNVLSIAGGMDVNMGRGQYLPIVLEYSFFPSSSTVTASYIAFRIGWGWR